MSEREPTKLEQFFAKLDAEIGDELEASDITTDEIVALIRADRDCEAELAALRVERDTLAEIVNRAKQLQHVDSLFRGGFRPDLSVTLAEAITELAQERDAARVERDTAQAALAAILRTAIRTDDEHYGTSCDWGQCSNEAGFWRVDPHTGYELPVCPDCAIKPDDEALKTAEAARDAAVTHAAALEEELRLLRGQQ